MRDGDLVRVKAYGGEELVRRLVEVRGDVVLICRDEEYEAARREGRHPVCVGFHKEDIIGE
jgi:hypothetical protein